MNVAVTIKKDYDCLKPTDFGKENEGLRLAGKYLTQDNKELKEENKKLEKAVGTLNTEISALKSHIRDLQINIKVYINKQKKVFKTQFKVLIGACEK
ncbi:hypothetical protein [Bacillus mycoides]|uniref:hypothetical protein n=1 Tax=Bacillus mycoides TaxID=1405 RepID=UPI003A8033F0